MAKLIDASVWKFLLVGVGNTLLSAAIMFLLYNIGGVSAPVSSAAAYLAGAVMSFFLNRCFTFQSSEAFWPSAVKFALNVAVLWAIAYLLIQPPLAQLLQRWMSLKWADNLSMLFCMGVYTVLNYFGQRFFAFKKS